MSSHINLADESTVWVYRLAPEEFRDRIGITMPRGAVVLSAQNQFDGLAIWVRVNPKADHVLRKFRLAGTGHPLAGTACPSLNLPPEAVYVGTVQFNAGTFVLHVFDLGED